MHRYIYSVAIIMVTVSLTSICIWESLNAVSVLCDVHDGHTRYLSQPSLQISVTSCHNITSMLYIGDGASLYNTSSTIYTYTMIYNIKVLYIPKQVWRGQVTPISVTKFKLAVQHYYF